MYFNFFSMMYWWCIAKGWHGTLVVDPMVEASWRSAAPKLGRGVASWLPRAGRSQGCSSTTTNWWASSWRNLEQRSDVYRNLLKIYLESTSRDYLDLSRSSCFYLVYLYVYIFYICIYLYMSGSARVSQRHIERIFLMIWLRLNLAVASRKLLLVTVFCNWGIGIKPEKTRIK